MHRVDRSEVQLILHEYKKACFNYQHGTVEHHQVAQEARRFAAEIVAENFHYEFKKPINPERAEIFGMIENYVREAVLPPVLYKLAERIVVLEKRQAAGMRCLEQLLTLVERGVTEPSSHER